MDLERVVHVGAALEEGISSSWTLFWKAVDHVNSRAMPFVASLRHLVSETRNDHVTIEKHVDSSGGSLWAGHLFLIYDFFVSLEALKCRLNSNEAQMPLRIPVLGEGVPFTLVSLLTLCASSGPQNHLINLGFLSHIFSDSKEQSSPCQLFLEACESGGWKPEGLRACLLALG